MLLSPSLPLIYGLLSSFLWSETLAVSLLHSALSPSQTKPCRGGGLGHGNRHLRSASGRRWGEVVSTVGLGVLRSHLDNLQFREEETLVFPVSFRYKLTMIAGDATGDTNFIMFGKWVHRLAKKSADTLVAENPKDFIPNEITGLLEKTFKWNVSFTQQTTSSSKVCFQVNAVIAEISDTNTLLSITPTTSQSSSLMISQGAHSSIKRTPQKSVALSSPSKPTTSLPTHASSATPVKTSLALSAPQLTPQSRRQPDDNQTLVSTGDAAPGDSSTKKRSRHSPNKRVAKKLFTGEEVGDDNAESDDGAAAVDHTRGSPTKDA